MYGNLVTMKSGSMVVGGNHLNSSIMVFHGYQVTTSYNCIGNQRGNHRGNHGVGYHGGYQNKCTCLAGQAILEIANDKNRKIENKNCHW